MKKTIFDIKFDAILSKNDLAREFIEMNQLGIIDSQKLDFLIGKLINIEDCIGTMGEPSVRKIKFTEK
jgi:hypothetical protein